MLPSDSPLKVTPMEGAEVLVAGGPVMHQTPGALPLISLLQIGGIKQGHQHA